MLPKKILFPTDFSCLSDAALPLATSLARDRSAELIILHVQEPSKLYAAGAMYYGPLDPSPELFGKCSIKSFQQTLQCCVPIA